MESPLEASFDLQHLAATVAALDAAEGGADAGPLLGPQLESYLHEEADGDESDYAPSDQDSGYSSGEAIGCESDDEDVEGRPVPPSYRRYRALLLLAQTCSVARALVADWAEQQLVQRRKHVEDEPGMAFARALEPSRCVFTGPRQLAEYDELVLEATSALRLQRGPGLQKYLEDMYGPSARSLGDAKLGGIYLIADRSLRPTVVGAGDRSFALRVVSTNPCLGRAHAVDWAWRDSIFVNFDADYITDMVWELAHDFKLAWPNGRKRLARNHCDRAFADRNAAATYDPTDLDAALYIDLMRSGTAEPDPSSYHSLPDFGVAQPDSIVWCDRRLSDHTCSDEHDPLGQAKALLYCGRADFERFIQHVAPLAFTRAAAQQHYVAPGSV